MQGTAAVSFIDWMPEQVRHDGSDETQCRNIPGLAALLELVAGVFSGG
jgi:hypothetical protein